MIDELRKGNRNTSLFITHHLSFIIIFRRLLKSRRLIWALATKELRARYVGSVGGVAWNVIQPLALIAIFTFVFSYLLKMREFGGGKNYIFYLVSGLLPWNAFQEALQRSSNIFVENSRLIQRIPFPIESFVAQAMLTSLLNLVIGLAILIIFMPILGAPYGPSLLLLPVAIILEALLMMGPALALASLTPFWRDVPPFTSLGLFIGFWLTPIVYMPGLLPGGLARWFALNPFYHLAMFFRASFTGAGFPSARAMVGLLAASIFMLIIGARIFFKTHRKVPELL